MALVDPAAALVLVLFDKHHPKGHHQHFPDGKEAPYAFHTVEKLIADYLKAIESEEKKYENKKD